MLFNSFDFAVFLAAVWPVYRLLQGKRLPRLLWILAISAVFYGCWKPWYLILIFASTAMQFFVGGRIHKAKTDKGRTQWLWAGIVGDLCMLGGRRVEPPPRAVTRLRSMPFSPGACMRP